MGLDEAVTPPRVVAGIGFRQATTAAEIVALLNRALAEAGLASGQLTAIATAADRAGEPAIREAATVFGLAPIALDAAALTAVDARVVTRSRRIEASRGVGSVAEAAALACAGAAARLVLHRIASAGATCALAVADRASSLP
ncbi:cobalamin biosynthesis protein [Methylorubrum extorquens]|uniref:cobalamin biosynthesis protein n=1 Tax=Methylorubrum extorquens TaxID=408 RepID=UPI0020A1D5C6|nr:cobalamin biosynthesis protein [Methylorubrum extorquens]